MEGSDHNFFLGVEGGGGGQILLHSGCKNQSLADCRIKTDFFEGL